MNNDRIRYSIKFDRYVSLIDGAEFTFAVHDASSKKAAYDRMTQHATAVIQAIESRSGPLSDTELYAGVSHREDRPLAQQIADHAPDAQPRHNPEKDNPYKVALSLGLGNANLKETKQQMYERLAAEWEAKHQAKSAQAAFDNDPQRVALRTKVQRILQGAKYDASLTQSDLEDLETILHVAKTSDNLAEPHGLLDAWHGRQRDRIDGEVSKLDEQVAALRKRRDALESRPVTVELPTPTLTATKYPKVAADSPEWEQFASPAQREAKSAAAEINAE
jgi:hypothetical protein